MTPQRTRKIKENQDNLLSRILRDGIVMPSCTRCRKDPRRVCVVATDSDRCAECVRAGGNVLCDVWGPTKSEWRALERTEKELARAWEEAQRDQQRLFEQLASQQAKLLRINKQREMFRARAGEMLRRGLRSLDELDAAEKEEEEQRRSQHVPSFSNVADEHPRSDLLPDSDGPDFSDPSFWDSLDLSGVDTSVFGLPEKEVHGGSFVPFLEVPDAGGGTPRASQGS